MFYRLSLSVQTTVVAGTVWAQFLMQVLTWGCDFRDCFRCFNQWHFSFKNKFSFSFSFYINGI